MSKYKIWQDMHWDALPRHCKGHGQLPPCLGQSESLHDANGFKLWESNTNQNPLWELAEPTLKLAHKYCWNQSHVLLDSMSCAMRVAFFCERWCVDKSKSCFAGCMLLKYVHSIATMSSENTVCKTNFKRTSLLYSACLHWIHKEARIHLGFTNSCLIPWVDMFTFFRNVDFHAEGFRCESCSHRMELEWS